VTQGVEPVIITNDADAAPYPWERTHMLHRPPARTGKRLKAQRAIRRLTGWDHVDQRQYAVAALRILRKNPPQAVVCVNDPEIAVYLSRHLPSTKVVHWFVNLQLASDRWRRSYNRDRTITTIACSRYLARAVELSYLLTPGSVACVYPGVDTDHFQPRPRDPDRRPVIGFFGRVCVEKAPDVLLDACLRLSRTRQDFAVALIGDTNWGFSVANPYRLGVDRLVSELETAGIAVHRHGHIERSDLPDALAEIDIQVTPSRWDEPFGLVVVEGMATGLPVIGSAAGGIPEIIGGVGEIVAREDPAALATVLNRLLDDSQRREAMAFASRSRAEAFTWAETWDGILQATGLTAAT
jgi:glycosyltransferase involved in cell wall biosynthesis